MAAPAVKHRKWRFGAGYFNVVLAIIVGVTVSASGVASLISSPDADASGIAGRLALAGGGAVVALTGLMLRNRNYLILGANGDAVEICVAGRKVTYDIGRLTFFVPTSPELHAPYVRYSVDEGPHKTCGLLSQGRVIQPLQIASFRRRLEDLGLRWQEVRQ